MIVRCPGLDLDKLQSEVKDMIRTALDQAGGVAYLVKQSNENPTAFLALIGRILPKAIKADIDVAATAITRVEHVVVKPAT